MYKQGLKIINTTGEKWAGIAKARSIKKEEEGIKETKKMK